MPRLTGLYERGFPGEPFDAALRYRVVRVWEVAAHDWQSSGLGLVALAPLARLELRSSPRALNLPLERTVTAA